MNVDAEPKSPRDLPRRGNTLCQRERFWRRRELNPRPTVRITSLYMLVRCLSFGSTIPHRPDLVEPIRLNLFVGAQPEPHRLTAQYMTPDPRP